jgi:UDPglucose 6-dehydrogenase
VRQNYNVFLSPAKNNAKIWLIEKKRILLRAILKRDNDMKIAIVGTGYVGLVTGACFAEMGTEVYCVDVNVAKIENLRKGIIPIYEPGLEEMVTRNHEVGRLHFTTELAPVLDEVDIMFSAVGTPPGEDGSADLKYVLEVARTAGRAMNKYLLVVTKSTVPVGTAQKIKQTIREEQAKRGVSIDFDIASNPEFLKEGAAVKDFMHPDRVVVGVESDRAKKLMEKLYHPFMLNNFRIIYMDVSSAEMTKYAANAMLATRISFMNDMANLCEIIGADINMVRKGVGADTRIGNSFLYAGCGYGGSCFPKDVKALIKTACTHQYPMRILQAVEDVNEDQKTILFRKLKACCNDDLQGKQIALWGLAFKPETDDMREAPSLVVIEALLEAGCRVTAYDPVAMTEAGRHTGDRIRYAKDIYEAVEGADALLIVTEWKEFRLPSWTIIRRRMKTPLIIDGRNIYDANEMKENGFTYLCIGKK